MDSFISNWVNKVDYDQIKVLINKRDVYIWGAYVNGLVVYDSLNNNGIKCKAYIDGHKSVEEYKGVSVQGLDENLKPSESFVIVCVNGIRTDIVDYLSNREFVENEDYIYISNMVPLVKITECINGYSDSAGNTLVCDDRRIVANVIFEGWNNYVHLGKNFDVPEDSFLKVSFGSTIDISDNVVLKGNAEIESLEGGNLKIGKSCVIDKYARISSKGNAIEMGDYLSIGKNFFCINGKTSQVKIGCDCMISHDVSIMSASWHSILDIKKQRNASLEKEKHVLIGDHVWIGKNAVVMNNSNVGNGSIIGAGSVVKLSTEENTIIAGNPAKVIKNGYTWDRREGIAYLDK